MKSDFFSFRRWYFFSPKCSQVCVFWNVFFNKKISQLKKNITFQFFLKRKCRFRNFEKWKMWKKKAITYEVFEKIFIFFRNMIILAKYFFVKKISSSKLFWNWFSNSLIRERFWCFLCVFFFSNPKNA